jgi:hypothetical protein
VELHFLSKFKALTLDFDWGNPYTFKTAHRRYGRRLALRRLLRRHGHVPRLRGRPGPRSAARCHQGPRRRHGPSPVTVRRPHVFEAHRDVCRVSALPSAVSAAIASVLASTRVRVGVLRPVGQRDDVDNHPCGSLRSSSGVRRHDPGGAL